MVTRITPIQRRPRESAAVAVLPPQYPGIHLSFSRRQRVIYTAVTAWSRSNHTAPTGRGETPAVLV
jgi:hypothetical protein